jgi:hypothetical protein
LADGDSFRIADNSVQLESEYGTGEA